MKTTLDLPDDLFRDVKLRAVSQGRTMRDLVADFLRQGLGQSSAAIGATLPTSHRVIVTADGLPLIPGRPDVSAPRASLQDLLALEHQTLTELDMEQHLPRDVKRVGPPV